MLKWARGNSISYTSEGKGYSCPFTIRGRKAEYMDTDSGGYGFNFHSEVRARSCPENEDDGRKEEANLNLIKYKLDEYV